jgi:hypothetical protein
VVDDRREESSAPDDAHRHGLSGDDERDAVHSLIADRAGDSPAGGCTSGWNVPLSSNRVPAATGAFRNRIG